MQQALIDRRTTLLGIAGLIAPAQADDKPKSPIAHGVLAQNSLAQVFEPSPRTSLPDISVWGPKGKREISELKGRTVLMPLWAEWCAPCFAELPDFARLQQKYGNDKFAIVPILTATQKKFTPEILGQVLAMSHAGVFEPLIEENLGGRLLKMAQRAGGSSALPCNLLLAPDGRVVAREIGRVANDEDAEPAKSYKDTLLRAGNGAVQSRWGQADGEAFAAAMADGFLA